jgi:hypothetical protein
MDMTVEEKLQQLIGSQLMTICLLQTKLEEAQRRITELEEASKTKPDLKKVS